MIRTRMTVPIEPTQEMLDEAEFAIQHNGPDPYFIWIHMLNAWQQIEQKKAVPGWLTTAP